MSPNHIDNVKMRVKSKIFLIKRIKSYATQNEFKNVWTKFSQMIKFE